ncbi:hypothetical protein LGK95_11315 [Clostridium algoriphilum]|uniref:hypothetical protein n=1 Tax=Clostridium algoriphilum TaxID=198347 RepID=UPI001CF12C4D|nr:hypothetical protein [Clostridium algoriphilum]MCB2294108.1 hypothetical protein [Clostridium algoriphilum]
MINKFIIEEEVNRCLLCFDAPCSKKCEVGKDPASIILSLRFKNNKAAAVKAQDFESQYGSCVKACHNKMSCMKNCIRAKIDRPIKIPMLMNYISNSNKIEEEVGDER